MLGQFDIKKWVMDHPEARRFRPSSSAGTTKDKPKKPNKTKDACTQARSWLANVRPAIEGQGGSGHTFGVACTLLKGFDLSQSEALALLKEWNITCKPPWDDDDLSRKISEADKKTSLQPNGYKLNKYSIDYAFSGLFTEEPKSMDQVEARSYSPMLDDPAAIVGRIVKHYNTDKNLCIFRWWNDQFYRWNGSHYEAIPIKEMNSIIFWFIEDAYIKKYLEDCANSPLDLVERVTKRKVSNSVIETVKTALIKEIMIDAKGKSEPFWLTAAPYSWEVDQIIPANNRLIHLPTFTSSDPDFYIPKTPKYFSTYSLNYDFDFPPYSGPVSPPPVWDSFLTSVWPYDPASILALQEWFGYLLCSNTSLQKLLMLIGVRRSGKGTILRVLNHMLGYQNVAYPTFKLLTSDFGKQTLIGKSLAIFPDARITSRTDVGDLVELLLSITGEDSQTINRKFMEATTKKLFCRFIISSNVLPSLSENSGALVSRAVILKFGQSFLGQEDTELEQKLIPEIPDILRWSIDGWIRINQQKVFTQPASGEQLVKHFLNLSSPISNYVCDCLDEHPSHKDDLMKMFSNYRNWCRAQNREYIGDLTSFQRNLQSVIPSISFSDYNTIHNGDQVAWSREVTGIRVKPLLNGHINSSANDSGIAGNEFDEVYGVEN